MIGDGFSVKAHQYLMQPVVLIDPQDSCSQFPYTRTRF